MSVIVVPVANRPECVHALKVAFDLSGSVGGQVVGYHLHPHKYDSKKIKTPRGPAKEAFDLFEDMATKADMPVKKTGNAGAGATAVWKEMLGTPDKVMPVIAPMSDVIVVSRPKGSGKGKQGKVAREFVLEALRSGNRPTLILPQRRLASVGKRVIVAWDQSSAAVQALVGALPILQQAEQVVIHTAGADFHTAPKVGHARNYLAMHGIKAKISKSKGLHVERELEEAYDTHNADLLVMGAYSRSRFMERLLGGTSEHFIMKTKIPVLATHPAS